MYAETISIRIVVAVDTSAKQSTQNVGTNALILMRLGIVICRTSGDHHCGTDISRLSVDRRCLKYQGVVVAFNRVPLFNLVERFLCDVGELTGEECEKGFVCGARG